MGYLTVEQNFDPTDNEQDMEAEISNVPTKRKVKRCYYSDIVGSPILDAITGEQYPWRVGSFNENRFFKVTDTTNNVDTTRKGDYDSCYGRSSHKAYYENPHSYMNHKRIELDEELVRQWYDKVNRLFPGEYTQTQT